MIGEVYNGSNRNIHWVSVPTNFFDATGGLITVANGYTWFDYHIRPNEKTCFYVMIPPPAGWTRYEFEIPHFSSSDDPRPLLTVFNDSGAVSGSTSYRIIGQVRNDDTARVNSVRIVATLYNNSDVPIGCGMTGVSSTNLDPGQTSSFILSYYGRSWDDVQAYHLQHDGDPQ